MPGIEDLMNIRTQGGTANAPPMPPPGMGGPPPGMGGPPPGMGGPPPGMGGPPPGMGGPPPEEASSIESDSALLAEAVVDRTQGNVEAAIAVLDNAKSMLIASINEQPPGMGGPPPEMGGPPMNAAYGRPLMRQSGGPLYRQGGGSMSDDDVLRQMIMDNLQKPEVQEQAMAQVMGQSGRTMSDMGSRKRETIKNLLRFTQG